MICEVCGDTGVLNTVLGESFYYCRTCKNEIELQERPSGVFIDDFLKFPQEDYEQWLDSLPNNGDPLDDGESGL